MDDFDRRMTKRFDAEGGSAFPVFTDGLECWGMSMRDYFAAKAMQGTIVSKRYDSPEETAERAYRIADAMLAMRLWEEKK